MHVSVGVYKNGQYVVNIVKDEDLESHIDYNRTFRWGRGLFVDGVCKNKGYLTDEEVEQWLKKISEMKFNMSRPTIPYR